MPVGAAVRDVDGEIVSIIRIGLSLPLAVAFVTNECHVWACEGQEAFADLAL